MSMTRNGIVYDLSKSTFTTTLDDITFIFSSRLHKTKFKEKCDINRVTFAEKFFKKYGVEVATYSLADILLYESIETRGFMIVLNDGGVVTCLNDLILNGGKATKRNLNE